MNTALQIKVLSLLGYVAVSTALVLLLADERIVAGQSLFTIATLP